MRVPSDFFYWYTTLFEAFDFSIHDLQQFLHEVKFSVDLDLIEWNEDVLIRETLFKITYVEGTMKFDEFLR